MDHAYIPLAYFFFPPWISEQLIASFLEQSEVTFQKLSLS